MSTDSKEIIENRPSAAIIPHPVARERGVSSEANDTDILHLAELVPVLRERLDIDPAFTDDAVLASVQTIMRQTSPRERWRAAFGSNLGHWLGLQGRDLNTALNTLVALLPKPRM